MITRGSTYTETFNFKTADGQSALIGDRKFEIIVKRQNFVRKYDEKNGLRYNPDSIVLTIPAAETSKFKFSQVFYSLNEIFEDGSNTISSGVIDIE